MPAEITRQEFLTALAGATVAPAALAAHPASAGRLLIAVAHPDDEYACSATIYRLVRELGWTADQVVITNGEGGYRYSTLAESIYGKPLVSQRSSLTAVRREETLRAGRILGIGHHFFLDQKDLGFASDAATADASYWDRPGILESLRAIFARGRYDLVLTLLPTAQTHTHHRATAQLVVEALLATDQAARPLVLGADPRARASAPLEFNNSLPVLEFDRTSSFGYHSALDYQIVVNWVIAEYKSQGLFQKDAGKHDIEQFWQLGPQTDRTEQVLADLQQRLRPSMAVGSAQ